MCWVRSAAQTVTRHTTTTSHYHEVHDQHHQDLPNFYRSLFKYQSHSLLLYFTYFLRFPLAAEGRSVPSCRSPLFMEMRRQRRENRFLSLLVHALVTLITLLVSFALLDRYP